MATVNEIAAAQGPQPPCLEQALFFERRIVVWKNTRHIRKADAIKRAIRNVDATIDSDMISPPNLETNGWTIVNITASKDYGGGIIDETDERCRVSVVCRIVIRKPVELPLDLDDRKGPERPSDETIWTYVREDAIALQLPSSAVMPSATSVQ